MTETDIHLRCFEFARGIVRLIKSAGIDPVGRVLVNQMLRSGTSVGANVEEAQASQSRADFASKMAIACKEAREANYWLRLFKAERLAAGSAIDDLLTESDQLVRIISAIMISTKRNSSIP